jgi:hypothetical protein
LALTSAEREELLRDVPTLEEFWASFNKSKAEWAQQQSDWKRELAESRAKWEWQLAESRAVSDRDFAELKRLQKKNEKIIGDLGNSVGALIETLVAGRIWEKFKDTPYSCLRQATRRVEISDGKRIITDVDILLFDTDVCMAVEVKREPAIRDIDHHVKRMGLIRKYPPLGTRDMKLAGAAAAPLTIAL